jgi:hypothetical protein
MNQERHLERKHGLAGQGRRRASKARRYQLKQEHTKGPYAGAMKRPYAGANQYMEPHTTQNPNRALHKASYDV